MFEKFASLTRFSHDWTITEKLDGSNGQILIVDEHEITEDGAGFELAQVGNLVVFAGSRKKLVTPGKTTDNYGFARFVQDNAEEIVAKLGEGRHFGEWVGKGVNKRGYGLDEKRFVLFNTSRWTGADLPERVDVVPIIAEGYMDNPGGAAIDAMAMMKKFGSVYAPGFMDPEGVVMRHGPSGTVFKKTFDYDEQGKWAEKLENRGA